MVKRTRMTPQKEESLVQKFENLPEDFVKLVEKSVAENYTDLLQKQTVHADGRIYPNEVILRVGFRNQDGIRQWNFLASTDHDPKEKNALDQLYLCLDALQSMFEEALQSEFEIDFPMDWKEFSWESGSIFLKHDTVNTKLEAEADALLGEDFQQTKLSEEEIGAEFFEKPNPEEIH